MRMMTPDPNLNKLIKQQQEVTQFYLIQFLSFKEIIKNTNKTLLQLTPRSPSMKTDQKQIHPPTNSNEPICKKIQNYIFKFSDLLGQGNFSKVYKAHHQITNEKVAVKIIELNSLKSQKLQELLFSEIDVLKKLNHPNILQCHQVYTSNRNCYIVTEICNGGDLQTKLRKEHHFTQQSAQSIIKDIFSGLLYLANQNVIHRDLKVANVFLHNGRAKIADFGFAKFTRQNFKDINIGSPIYMAPEGLIHNIYGPKTDIWAFGILLYELMHGETPYAQCRTENQLKCAISAQITQKQLKSQLSPELKDLILKCLEINEAKRITAFEIENHAYFRKIMDKSPLRRMDSPLIEKNYTSSSQRFLGNANTSSQRLISRYNFLATKDEKQHNTLKPFYHDQSNKKSLSPMPINGGEANRSNGFRGFSTEKNLMMYNKSKKDLSINQKNTSTNKINDQMSNQADGSKIFSTMITFKECVNILHYCRLIYKFVILLRETKHHDENLGNTFSVWVLSLMNEIKARINQNKITYEGDNAWLRQKKLRQVTNQYAKKYREQLTDIPGISTSLSSILELSKDFYTYVNGQIAKSQDKNWIILGHYIIMIAYSTHLIRRCYNQSNYKPLGQYKEIEQFLNKNKESMDSQSYYVLRKKISYIQ